MNRKFVVHRHSGVGPTHWDLMIQAGNALATWQLADEPTPDALREGMTARRIADHRLAYLTYEGPVSRGRGEVRAVEGGRARVVQAEAERWLVRLGGLRLIGSLEIARLPGDDEWRLTLSDRQDDGPDHRRR
jgi:hypothetical protein